MRYDYMRYDYQRCLAAYRWRNTTHRIARTGIEPKEKLRPASLGHQASARLVGPQAPLDDPLPRSPCTPPSSTSPVR